MRIWIADAPEDYPGLLVPLPADIEFVDAPDDDVDLVQLFVTEREVLADSLERLRRILGPTAALWVSWPKKASGRPSTVTEDVVRELALPLGFVDNKVCAVDAVWSGLRLVLRRSLR